MPEERTYIGYWNVHIWTDEQCTVPDGEIRFNIRIQTPSKTVITTYPWGDDYKEKKGYELTEKFSLSSEKFLKEIDFIKLISDWITNMLNEILMQQVKDNEEIL